MNSSYYIVRAFFDPVALLFFALIVVLYLISKGQQQVERVSGGEKGRKVLICIIAMLYAFSIEPTSKLLHYPLEKEFLPLKGKQAPKADYYVVLGGGVWEVEPKGVVPAFSSYLRVYRMVLEAEQSSGKIIFSGRGPKVSEAKVLADFALKLGLDPQRIMLEEKGRTTWEEAEEVSQMLPSSSRIALVTSATHMKRSLFAFSHFFDTVLPMPSHFDDLDHGYIARKFIPNNRSFSASSSAIHEYIGLIWYAVKAYFQ